MEKKPTKNTKFLSVSHVTFSKFWIPGVFKQIVFCAPKISGWFFSASQVGVLFLRPPRRPTIRKKGRNVSYSYFYVTPTTWLLLHYTEGGGLKKKTRQETNWWRKRDIIFKLIFSILLIFGSLPCVWKNIKFRLRFSFKLQQLVVSVEYYELFTANVALCNIKKNCKLFLYTSLMGTKKTSNIKLPKIAVTTFYSYSIFWAHFERDLQNEISSFYVLVFPAEMPISPPAASLTFDFIPEYFFRPKNSVTNRARTNSRKNWLENRNHLSSWVIVAIARLSTSS